jgi:hypothetical protein
MVKGSIKPTIGVYALVAMALTMEHAGMTQLLAAVLSGTGVFFPLLSPLLGALGAFMTGSNTNSNVIFGQLQMQTAVALSLSVPLILAAQTAVIAAKSLGIDSLLTNGIHRGDMERVWKILDLPGEHCFPMIALVLGYPTEEPKHDKGRLDGIGVIHEETYRRPTEEELKEITRKYDDKEAHIALNEEWDKEGYAHFQDWLYKYWLGGASKPTSGETQMLKLLKRSGYVEK